MDRGASGRQRHSVHPTGRARSDSARADQPLRGQLVRGSEDALPHARQRSDRSPLRKQSQRVVGRRRRRGQPSQECARHDASPGASLRGAAGLYRRRRDPLLDARARDRPRMTEATLHLELGLTDDEYAAITARLGRTPTYTELAMFSVMWSEHCSYKSSRVHLETLPTEGERILVGPGEGAGIIEVADGVAVAWKIESHNHPSFVEPFNGAATGVGGIVRDILSMGARPIALMDPLRFGPLDDAHTRYVMDGVVNGISGYGNSIGVPTVGGEAVFDECYADNPLVNVACLGIIEDTLMRGRADGVGNSVVLIGSSTGR